MKTLASTRSGTKIAAGTNAGTEFPLSFNEMSGVPAFTPVFRSTVSVNKALANSVGKNVDSVGYQLNVLDNIDRKTESPPFSRGAVMTGYNHHRYSGTKSRRILWKYQIGNWFLRSRLAGI